MKVYQLILVVLIAWAYWMLGAVCEKRATGMKPSRKIDLTIKSIFSLITFKKFYICDECGKIHKREETDLDICGGRFAHKVFVANRCASGVMRQAHKVIRDAVYRNSTDSLSQFLTTRAKLPEMPLNDYDTTFMVDAANRLDELTMQNKELRNKIYGG